MLYLLNHHKRCMRSSHGRLRLGVDISSESMEAIICFTSGIEPVRVLEWQMTLLSGWNWLELMLKAGDGGRGDENTEILHSWCFCPFFFPFLPFFPPSLSLAPEKQIRVFISVWLRLMQWGERLVILGWEGSYWKAKGKGICPALDVLKFKRTTRSSGHCTGLGSDLFGAHIAHKWSQCALGMPWGPLAFKGCCQKKANQTKLHLKQSSVQAPENPPSALLINIDQAGSWH